MPNTPPGGFALRFISGKYQGGEVPLRPDREVVIGRSSELDVVLVEDMVSRKHAKIALANGKIVIQDLGSTNGTFVNGEKVAQSRLQTGDRILIGTSILKLVAADGSGQNFDAGAINQRLEQVAATKTLHGGAMNGRIEEVPIPDLLQLFATSKKNGVLAISGDHQGHIHLRQGNVVFAAVEGAERLGPRKSFFRILSWESGRFALEPPSAEEFPIELEEHTEALLMEGMRQLDELRLIQKDLPSGGSHLTVPQPLLAPLRELSPEQLDVFQAALNYGTLAAVLDRSPLTDRDTAEAVAHLLRGAFLQAR